MKVSYTTHMNDMVEFNILHISQLPQFRKRVTMHRIILPIVYGLVSVGGFIAFQKFWPAWGLLMFLAILWAIFYPRVSEEQIRKQVTKSLKRRETEFNSENVNEITVQPNGLQIKTPGINGFLPWSKVHHVITNLNYIFIYVNPDEAIMIPKNRIIENCDFETLKRTISTHSYKFIQAEEVVEA